MALWLRALTFPGSILTKQIIPVCAHDSKRTWFTMVPRRQARPKNTRRKVKPPVVPIMPTQLYENEIDSFVLDARKEDLPDDNIENPFQKEKLQCILCKYKLTPDYKNVKLLSQFVSPHTGRIYGRHITGLCKHQQESIEREIRKSQDAGFMATYLKQVEFLKDPRLCDPTRPIRPHPY